MSHPLVVHCKKKPYDVYIGRGSKWGNPYSHSFEPTKHPTIQVPTRADAITSYREYLLNDWRLKADLPELRGKVLGCYCAPLPCHGDVLAELANE